VKYVRIDCVYTVEISLVFLLKVQKRDQEVSKYTHKHTHKHTHTRARKIRMRGGM
jgi:hypothetical protein